MSDTAVSEDQVRLVCGDNSPVFTRRDLLCFHSKVLDGILSSQAVSVTLILSEFSLLSVEVLVSLMTWGSAEDKDLSKDDITEVKNLAAQLGIVLESLQVSVVQNPNQGKTENRNTEDSSEHGKVGSELMVEV